MSSSRTGTTTDDRPRSWPWWKAVLVVTVVAVVLVALVVAAGLALLVWRLSDVGPSLTVEDDRVQQWLASTEPELAAVAERHAGVAATALPDGTHPVARVTTWRCDRGQHNWKVDDPYDLACTRQTGVLLAVPGASDDDTGTADGEAFLADMRAVEDALADVGAVHQQPPGLADFLSGYTDRFGTQAGGRTYGPAQLPTYGWRPPADAAVDEPADGVALVFTGADEPSPHVLLYPGDELTWTDANGDPLAVSTVPTRLEGAAYGVLLTVSAHEDWTA